ncbi:hypothetical protein HF086_016178 [Spodoptera exigua]|uniref:Integrase catalytic domain-containing protein n=1 Tax=Spodoptera exigua TaxID=7107 RepID=A0A922SGP2_SPOEX|nr:hypothetical protein HF086_016178 [Spodoptera exigua]
MSDHREDSVSDVSCADVTLFKNGTETVPPSSEVGSQEISTHTTSSSARLPPEQLEPANNQRREPVLVSNASTEAISQSRPHTYHDQGMRMDGIPPQFLMQMMEMMQRMSERLCAPPTESKIRIKDIYLPSFDPDTHVGVREWCQHIDQAIEAYKLSDFDVRMKVCSLLKGRAKMWVDDWMVNSSTWEELRKNLITTFEPENRYSRDIAMFREHVYDSSKDIAEFLSRAWILWRRVTKDKLGDEHAVEAVIGCVNDERLRIELLNARATTVPELISVATSIRKKRSHPSSNSTMPNKRSRFADSQPSTSSCRICKKTNHSTNDCRFKPPEAKPETGNKDPKAQTIPTCTYCKKPGHSYETCFKRERSLTSNVNYVGSNKLAPIFIKIGGKTLQAVFDSGAECSIMRESVAMVLPGQRSSAVNYLKGIGQFPALSLTKLTTICVIDTINIELEFHVLPDYEMSTDILVGMNLIHDTNLNVIITPHGTKLVHNTIINLVCTNSPIFNHLDCDLTSEDEISQLRGLLNKYEHLFILDGGREFLGEFKDYCDHAGINIHAIAPGVSRANGQVERVVATLKNALVMIKNYETEQWHTTLEELQLAMNCTTHRVTGVAPLTLITQRKHCVPSELLSIVNIDTETVDIEALSQQVLQKMSRSSEQDRQRFNQHKAKIHHFQIGDYVLIKNNPRNQTSLDLKFSEPYEVSRVLENDRYLVKKVVGRGRPRKVAHDQLRRAPQPGEQLTVSAGNGSPGHQESAAFEPIPSTSRDPENHELQGENNSPE